jgi:hypothetical protein
MVGEADVAEEADMVGEADVAEEQPEAQRTRVSHPPGPR